MVIVSKSCCVLSTFLSRNMITYLWAMPSTTFFCCSLICDSRGTMTPHGVAFISSVTKTQFPFFPSLLFFISVAGSYSSCRIWNAFKFMCQAFHSGMLYQLCTQSSVNRLHCRSLSVFYAHACCCSLKIQSESKIIYVNIRCEFEANHAAILSKLWLH